MTVALATQVARRKLPALPAGCRGTMLAFTQDGQRLCVATSQCTVVVFMLPTDTTTAAVSVVFDCLSGRASLPGVESSDSDSDASGTINCSVLLMYLLCMGT